jgi:hypothetical protein
MAADGLRARWRRRLVATASVAAAVAASTLVGLAPASADGDCHPVKRFWFDEGRRRVYAWNEMVCLGGGGHGNSVTIRRYNPYTGDMVEVARGRGFVEYACEGTGLRYFYGPGPRLDIYCS